VTDRQFVKLTNGKLVFYEDGRWFEQRANCTERAFGVEEDVERFARSKSVAIVNDKCLECGNIGRCNGDCDNFAEESRKMRVEIEDADVGHVESLQISDLEDVAKGCAETKAEIERMYLVNVEGEEQQDLIKKILAGKLKWNLGREQ
jgi:hypothetical protein